MTAARGRAPLFRCDGAIDIECAGWDRFVVGAVVDAAGRGAVTSSPDRFVDDVCGRRGWIWAWNGGKYDFLMIAEVLRRRGRRVVMTPAGGSISRMQIVGGPLLVDAHRLCPMPLDEACALAGLPARGGLGWPCSCRLACGGYCAITGREDLYQRAQLADYCHADAVAVVQIVQAVQAEAARAGLALRGTIGGTAWATAARDLALPKAGAVLPPYAWAGARRAYYGGRVAVMRPASPAGTHWDLAGAYPAALARTALPCGEPASLGGAQAAAAFAHGAEGVYSAQVTVPAGTWLPPLPRRYGRRLDRIGYPVGTFCGTWAGIELRAAQAAGATIDRVSRAIVWDDRAVTFAPIVEAWHARRLAHGRGTAWGAWWRLLTNSLTGRLGQGNERESIVMHPPLVTICACKGSCEGRCGAWRSVDRWGEIWAIPSYAIGDSSHVQWAAYLTAATRIAWADGARAVGDGLAYGHTDSLWTAGDAAPSADVGAELGQWSRKHDYVDMRIRSPGAYRWIDPATGEFRASAAGIGTAAARIWRDAGSAIDGADTVTRGVRSLAEAAALGGGLFQARRTSRRLPDAGSKWYGDRVRAGDATRAASDAELRERYNR